MVFSLVEHDSFQYLFSGAGYRSRKFGPSTFPLHHEYVKIGTQTHRRAALPRPDFARPTLVAALFALLTLAGCKQPPSWRGQDVSGLMPDLAFELTDSSGARVRTEDLLGEVTLMYFGFTNCPDICPTTLSQIKVALQELGPEAEGIRVFLVSVDPDRDTPEAMAKYTAAFGPWLHGFTGSKTELKAINNSFKVDFLAQEPNLSGEYDVMHSNRVFGFDAEGRCRVLMPNTANTQAMAEDLRQLLAL
jgi:protein SCO1/2